MVASVEWNSLHEHAENMGKKNISSHSQTHIIVTEAMWLPFIFGQLVVV